MKSRLTEIKWGVIFALMTLVWLLLERLFGFHDERIDQHPIVTNLILIPAILVYVLALLEKRNKDYDGRITYKQALISGWIITAVVTLLVPVTQSIISLVITPEYFTNAAEYAIQNNLMSEDQAADYFNLQNYIVQGMIGTPIIGSITSLIIALFIRKK